MINDFQVGEVRDVRLIMGTKEKSRGYGYVEFLTKVSHQMIKWLMHGNISWYRKPGRQLHIVANREDYGNRLFIVKLCNNCI